MMTQCLLFSIRGNCYLKKNNKQNGNSPWWKFDKDPAENTLESL